MTPDQIRARCKKFVVEECNGRWPAISIMEYFYREALAKGLEMAAEIYESSGDEIGLSEVFREQANKLKESPCEPSSS